MVFELYCFRINDTIFKFHDKKAKGEKLDEDHQFLDWNCWDSFYDSIDKHLFDDEVDTDEYINASFLYSREHFRKLVNIIPYMLIERNCFFPCCNKFDNNLLYNFDASVTVAYFTCYNYEGVFKNVDEQLNHFQVSQNNKNQLTSDSTHRFYQIFHIWLSFYNHCKYNNVNK